MLDKKRIMEILGYDVDLSKVKIRVIPLSDMSDDERLRIDNGELFD